MAPIIKLNPEAELKLTTWALATGGYPGGQEFSGLFLVEREGKEIFHVVDADLLGVGSVGFTEFAPERALKLPEDPRRRGWFHRHPIHGWSGTDEHTCTKEPLGTSPQLVQWSVAIVLTPKGWIGRIDIHVPKLQTFHCPVEPAFASPEVLAAAQASITPELIGYCSELKAEYDAMHKRPASRFYPAYDDRDFDIYDEEPMFDDESVICPNCGVPCEYQGGEDVFGVMGVQAYVCERSCGNIILIADPHSCELYTASEAPIRRKKRSEPAWKQSFWGFWRNR
jgi:hypothetical protein